MHGSTHQVSTVYRSANNLENLCDALAVVLVLGTVRGGSIVLAVALLVRTGENWPFHCKNKKNSVSLCCSCELPNIHP